MNEERKIEILEAHGVTVLDLDGIRMAEHVPTDTLEYVDEIDDVDEFLASIGLPPPRCLACNGRGWRPLNNSIKYATGPCPKCKGRGEI